MGEAEAFRGTSEHVPLRRVDRYVWEIPKSYKPGMRVPGIIYADENLLEKMKSDLTIQQCANVAHLPGIYKWSITLPDGHEGYGFPIGGVAATDYEEGVISPGGVGYDINCLSGDSLILHELGFTLPIKQFEVDWSRQHIKCISTHKTTRSTDIVRFLKLANCKKVYKVRTMLGYEIIATDDHPFLTPRGMIRLSELNNEPVAVYPFKGIPYEKPNDITIVSEQTVNRLAIPCNKEAAIKELRKRGLVPLKANSDKFPYLIKIMGFALGDGSLIFTKKTHTVSFFGKAENLEEIRNDVMKLGFTPSRIYSRIRKGNIKTKYGLKSFTTVEHSFKVASRSFATLLKAMGVPSGIKAQQNFVLPKWVFKLPLWQKRLLLASFFGAELSSPLTMTWRNRTFYAPTLSQSKKAAYVNSGLAFMLQIKKLLQELGVSVNAITLEPKVNYGGGGAPSTRIRLQIKSTPENLIKLWSTIGFEYNYEKSFLANVAVAYLKLKEKIIRERSMTAKVVIAMRERGVKVQQIYQSLENNGVNHSFTERSLYGGRKTSPRIPLDFPSFKEYLEEATKGLGRSGAVWDRIVTKEEVQFSDFVYDFTVGDSNHNFIANGFVVSNCGVRLLRTNLDEKDVRPALLKLLDTLFDYIPSGLGSRGRIHVTPIELDKVVSDGVEWAVDKGYGWAEDIKRCEENGCMEAADPAKVSSTAKSRGCPQLGSLGSGNHFLEIEKVDRIFDQKVAESLGIKRLGQVLVLIHTGSRGFGHQVCSDYLRVMERAIHKYNIQLPDRELACAPAKSSEAEDYFAAMSAACNYAWANRQMITHWTREAFEKVFGKPADSLDMHLIYDVAHNIAKIEEHKVDGKRLKVFVHRKGATRAFPPGHGDVPAEYRELGQPVLIPGSMGTSSWILVGTPKAMEISFGSTAHGAGRYLSRASAKKRFWGSDVKKALEEKGILIKAASMAVVSEEAPGAYKDVDRVAEVSHELGIAKKVCRLVPMGVTKG